MYLQCLEVNAALAPTADDHCKELSSADQTHCV